MWIERKIGADLLRAAATRPALVLTGARQTGKTSLLRALFPGHGFVSLDLPAEAELAEQAPEDFLRRHPPPCIIDEVQYAPALFRGLKRAIDADRGANGQYLLTGSQKFPLMREVSDALAGRIAVFELDTLAFAEVRRALPEADPLDWLLRGGFPELWSAPGIDHASFLRSYVATYLERDLRQVLRVGNLRDFERFLRACAFRSANLVNKSDIARDVGVSVPTVGEWMGALQASNQIALLEPWYQNGAKGLTKSPKLYFLDTGLLNALLNVRTAADLIDSPLRGAIFETGAYGELRRTLQRTGEVDSLFFFRDRSREVDFLLNRGGLFHLFECKWTEHATATDLRGMTQAEALLGPERVRARTVICRAPTSHPIAGGGTAVGLADLAATVAD